MTLVVAVVLLPLAVVAVAAHAGTVQLDPARWRQTTQLLAACVVVVVAGLAGAVQLAPVRRRQTTPLLAPPHRPIQSWACLALAYGARFFHTRQPRHWPQSCRIRCASLV